MTKKQYLASLRKYLRFRLSNKEIDDILADMEECFDAGTAEGKSEEEICLSLGEPKIAAASLLSEQTGSERITSLAEVWLPLVISAVLYAVYTFCGFRVDIDTQGYVLPIMYVLPLIMWVLFERKSFFTALADYKCDFFTFFGSICMIAAELACNEVPKRMTFKNPPLNMQTYVILTAVFILAAMLLLAVSLWKNAPKLFSAVPLVVIPFIIYNSFVLIQSYNAWCGEPEQFFHSNSAAAGIGGSFSNILTIIYICASAFLIWSFINRNALTLASAYSAMTVTGFMFYWYYTLSAVDPTDEHSLAYIRYISSGKNYVLWGSIIAAAVLVMTIVVKLANRKKVG